MLRAALGPGDRLATVILVILAVSAGGSNSVAQTKGADGNNRVAAAEKESRRLPQALRFANGLLLENRYELAADEYSRFLKDGATGLDAAEAHYGLARARLFLNQYEESRAEFRAFLQAAPEHPNAATALFRVGETSYLLGDLAAARTALESYTKANPRHAHCDTAWPYLGDVCFRLNDFAGARTAYETALGQFPQGRLANRTRFFLGRTLAAQGDPAAAVRVLTELAAKGGPDWLDTAWFQIGQVELTANEPEKAVAAFKNLEQLAAASPLAPESQLRRAEALIALDRRDEAEALLKSLLTAQAEIAAAAAEVLGSSLWDRGFVDEALGVWDAALLKFPRATSAPALLSRSADALTKQGRVAEARQRLERVNSEWPKSSQAPRDLIRLARMSLEAQDLEAARTLAASFHGRFPNHPMRADARVVEARSLQAMGKDHLTEAIELYRRLLEEDEASLETAAAARYYLGLAYRAAGQEAEAAKLFEKLVSGPPSPAANDARFLVGKSHFEAKRYAEAVASLEQYLAGKPSSELAAPALAFVAVADSNTGKHAEARAALDRLSQEHPRSKALTWARLVLGESALARKQYHEAEELLDAVAAAKDVEYRARALLGLGWTRLQDGRPDAAAAVLSELVRDIPDDPLAAEAALLRAQALDAANEREQSLEAYTSVIERYSKSDQARAAALGRARLLADIGESDRAASEFGKYVEKYSADGKGSDSWDAILAEWGWSLMDARKTVEAAEVFRRLLAEHSTSPRAADARMVLAELAYRSGNTDDAVVLLEPVIAAGAATDVAIRQSALVLRGRIAFDKKDWQSAARDFELAIAESPDGKRSHEARFWKAEVALRSGDAVSAEQLFAALASDASEAAKPWIPSCRLRRIQSLAALKKWNEVLAASESFQSEFSKSSLVPEVAFARAQALMAQARFDEARAAFDSAITTDAASELSAKAQWMRGETYFHQKDYKSAIREYHKVELLYRAPEWQAAALLEAGKAYEKLGQWTQAAAAYEKLLRAFDRTSHAEEARRLLGEAKKRAAESPREGAPR